MLEMDNSELLILLESEHQLKAKAGLEGLVVGRLVPTGSSFSFWGRG